MHVEDTRLDRLVASPLVALFACLSRRERTVLRMRLVWARTLEQVGWELDLSGERVWQIEKQALATLRRRLKS